MGGRERCFVCVCVDKDKVIVVFIWPYACVFVCFLFLLKNIKAAEIENKYIDR